MTHPIVACARGWIGTRFHHQGRAKGVGVDCLGLLVGVARELDLRGPDGAPLSLEDEIDYAHQPDVERLRAKLVALLQEISPQGSQPGDVLLLAIDGRAQHLAIVSDWAHGLGMIHAYAPARAVVEHGLDEWWRARIEAAFRIQ